MGECHSQRLRAPTASQLHSVALIDVGTQTWHHVKAISLLVGVFASVSWLVVALLSHSLSALLMQTSAGPSLLFCRQARSLHHSPMPSLLCQVCWSFCKEKFLGIEKHLSCLAIFVPPGGQHSTPEFPTPPQACWEPPAGLSKMLALLRAPRQDFHTLPALLVCLQAGNPNHCSKVRKALSCPAPLGVQPSHLLGLHPAKHLSAHSSQSEISGTLTHLSPSQGSPDSLADAFPCQTPSPAPWLHDPQGPVYFF